jgi:hypothetical protein
VAKAAQTRGKGSYRTDIVRTCTGYTPRRVLRNFNVILVSRAEKTFEAENRTKSRSGSRGIHETPEGPDANHQRGRHVETCEAPQYHLEAGV